MINNCLNFIRIRNELKASTQIQVRFVEQKTNTYEVEDWKNFWLSKLEKTDLVASKRLHSWGNEFQNSGR